VNNVNLLDYFFISEMVFAIPFSAKTNDL